MRALAFVVEERFALAYGFTVVTRRATWSGPNVIRGQELTLVRPDGSSVVASVKSIPIVSGPGAREHASVTLEGEWEKDDVPIGTAVWVNDVTEAQPRSS